MTSLSQSTRTVDASRMSRRKREVIGVRLLDGDAGELGVAGPAGRVAGIGGRVV
jgi:hypothetical protein